MSTDARSNSEPNSADFRTADFCTLDFGRLNSHDRYKLLVSTVVPRPIAFVTSLDENGRTNAAPFSFFNSMGSDPPLLILGVGNHRPDRPKDTAHNIRRTHEFAVHIVDDALATRMNICAIDFPAEYNEVEIAGLETLPSLHIAPPRLAAAPVHFECREHSTLEIGSNRIIIGEVLCLHLRADLFDEEKLHVRTEKMHAIGRMHGAGWYARTSDLFQMARISYEEWQGKETNEDPSGRRDAAGSG